MRTVLRIVLCFILIVVIGAVGLLTWLSIEEYKPSEVEKVTINTNWETQKAQINQLYKIVTWNIGYAGLGKDSDFFMDGGKMVRAISKEVVDENIAGITSILDSTKADIYFLQEVDLDSTRSYRLNQLDKLEHGLGKNGIFACNYRCSYVPFPWPPLGKIDSGISSLTNFEISQAERISLPIPFSWPIRIANLKRCLLVERIPIENSDKELVLINFHLEAYDNGAGKIAQTKQLMGLLEEELQKGNYIIAGGDFNQTIEGANDYPRNMSDKDWAPGSIFKSDLSSGLSFAFDPEKPTCRSLLKPYAGDRDDTAFYLIDGFIVSENIKVKAIETLDMNFQYSDHNPVCMQFVMQ